MSRGSSWPTSRPATSIATAASRSRTCCAACPTSTAAPSSSSPTISTSPLGRTGGSCSRTATWFLRSAQLHRLAAGHRRRIMTWRDAAVLAARSVRRRPGRTGLTILAVALASALLTALLTIAGTARDPRPRRAGEGRSTGRHPRRCGRARSRPGRPGQRTAREGQAARRCCSESDRDGFPSCAPSCPWCRPGSM